MAGSRTAKTKTVKWGFILRSWIVAYPFVFLLCRLSLSPSLYFVGSWDRRILSICTRSKQTWNVFTLIFRQTWFNSDSFLELITSPAELIQPIYVNFNCRPILKLSWFTASKALGYKSFCFVTFKERHFRTLSKNVAGAIPRQSTCVKWNCV